jgi:hypothetical protein
MTQKAYQGKILGKKSHKKRISMRLYCARYQAFCAYCLVTVCGRCVTALSSTPANVRCLATITQARVNMGPTTCAVCTTIKRPTFLFRLPVLIEEHRENNPSNTQRATDPLAPRPITQHLYSQLFHIALVSIAEISKWNVRNPIRIHPTKCRLL